MGASLSLFIIFGLSSLFHTPSPVAWASQEAQWQRIHLPIQETQVRSLGQEDPLEKGIATHSSVLAWRIPWTNSLAGYSP